MMALPYVVPVENAYTLYMTDEEKQVYRKYLEVRMGVCVLAEKLTVVANKKTKKQTNKTKTHEGGRIHL